MNQIKILYGILKSYLHIFSRCSSDQIVFHYCGELNQWIGGIDTLKKYIVMNVIKFFMKKKESSKKVLNNSVFLIIIYTGEKNGKDKVK